MIPLPCQLSQRHVLRSRHDLARGLRRVRCIGSGAAGSAARRERLEDAAPASPRAGSLCGMKSACPETSRDCARRSRGSGAARRVLAKRVRARTGHQPEQEPRVRRPRRRLPGIASLLTLDALNRTESCGGHFREESQTPDGEALRDDDRFSYVAAWEFQGVDKPPTLTKTADVRVRQSRRSGATNSFQLPASSFQPRELVSWEPGAGSWKLRHAHLSQSLATSRTEGDR